MTDPKDYDFSDEDSAAMEAMQADKPLETQDEAPPPAEAKPAEEPEKDALPEPDESDAADDGSRPPKGFVPYNALYAEREARKALERKLADIEAKLQPKAEDEPKPEPIPDPVTEPDRFNAWLQKRDEDTRKQIEATDRQWREMQQRQTVAQTVARHEQAFRAEKPDYEAALAHLRDTRKRELAFFTDDAEAIDRHIGQEAWQIANWAVQVGRNPAEVVYEIARARGYAPKAADPAPDAGKRIEAQARAQEQTQSLSQASGPANTGLPTAEDLANMSEADFAKMDPDVIRKVMGG